MDSKTVPLQVDQRVALSKGVRLKLETPNMIESQQKWTTIIINVDTLGTYTCVLYQFISRRIKV